MCLKAGCSAESQGSSRCSGALDRAGCGAAGLRRTCDAALSFCSCSSVVADPLRAHGPRHVGQHRLCCARGAQSGPLPALRSCPTVSALHRHSRAGLTGAHRGALHSAAKQHQCCHRDQREWSHWPQVCLLLGESSVAGKKQCCWVKGLLLGECSAARQEYLLLGESSAVGGECLPLGEYSACCIESCDMKS